MNDLTDLKADDEFGKLEELGISSGYIQIKNGVMRPLITAEYALSRGFLPKGTKVRFLNENGYELERQQAAKVFDVNKTYTITCCEIGGSSSIYEFEEVVGRFNTVMFEKVE